MMMVKALALMVVVVGDHEMVALMVDGAVIGTVMTVKSESVMAMTMAMHSILTVAEFVADCYDHLHFQCSLHSQCSDCQRK